MKRTEYRCIYLDIESSVAAEFIIRGGPEAHLYSSLVNIIEALILLAHVLRSMSEE